MPQTIRNQYDKQLTFQKLLEAHDRASVNKRNKKELLLYQIDLESNLVNLYRHLKNGTYHIGKYRKFKVYEPKERIIKALPYQDRIVHQWYVEEFIKPYILPRFIATTYACIETKGTHMAVVQVQKYMRIMKRNLGSYYVLKCDVKRFFYSIDKDILFDIIKRFIRDKKLLRLTRSLIYEDGEEVGIPIGNYTSQFYANIYLNELDQFIKRKLKVKYYVRYMDDFILLLKNKEECRIYKKIIEQFLNNHLNLQLNEKSRYYPNSMGVDFCGYRIFETHRLLRNRSKKKIKKKIKKWNKTPVEELDFKKMGLCWNSWMAHASHSDSFHLRLKLYYSNKHHSSLELYLKKEKM